MERLGPGIRGRPGPGRVAAHLAKARNPAYRQADFFAGTVLCSFVESAGWLDHHRLELENDLIAGHVLTAGKPPRAQFLG